MGKYVPCQSCPISVAKDSEWQLAGIQKGIERCLVRANKILLPEDSDESEDRRAEHVPVGNEARVLF